MVDGNKNDTADDNIIFIYSNEKEDDAKSNRVSYKYVWYFGKINRKEGYFTCGCCGINFGINATKPLADVTHTLGRHISICKPNIEAKYVMRYVELSNIGMAEIQGNRRANKSIYFSISDLQDLASTNLSLSRRRSPVRLEMYTSTSLPISTHLICSSSTSTLAASSVFGLDNGGLQSTIYVYNIIV